MSSVTELGTRVDQVQWFLIAMMAFWFIACNMVMVYFMLRYRRRSKDQVVSTAAGNHTLEVVWTVIPSLIVIGIFYYGASVWKDMRTPPEDAMDIRVTGQKWSWLFEYPNGFTGAQNLYVPVGKPIKLTMKSKDVLHSFFIPEFRTKEDVVPSMYTYLWFQAEKPGTYNIFCTEYCGKDHSAMLGKIHVLDAENWESWEKTGLLKGEKVLTPLQRGEKLYTERGCVGCHSTDGKVIVGPSFKGLYGKKETLNDGTQVDVDDNYIVESIKYPNRKVVAGFQEGQMTSYDGQLSDEELADIITFIKSLNGN